MWGRLGATDASLKQGLRTQGNESDFNCKTLATIYMILSTLTQIHHV